MLKRITQIHRFVKRNSLRAPILVMAGIILLLVAQFIWWIIFFELNHRTQVEQVRVRESLILSLANNDDPEARHSPLLMRNGDSYEIREENLKKYEAVHREKFWMLVSETLFVLFLVLYGSYRTLRSVYREHVLAEERDIFINSVTHELKTPLASILLNIQTLQKRKLSPALRNELLEESIREIRRLEEQINNLLLSGQLIRRTGNKIPVDGVFRNGQEGADLVREIDDYIRENSPRFRRENVFIDFDIPEGPLRSPVHPDLFQKILSNLIQNSIQYSVPGPEIRVSLRRTDPKGSLRNKRESCILKVEDNGPGIPEGERKNIFKPFYRIKKDNRRVKGSGVGLYIVQEIVHGVNGTIRLRTRPDFPGSSFEVTLPLYDL